MIENWDAIKRDWPKVREEIKRPMQWHRSTKTMVAASAVAFASVVAFSVVDSREKAMRQEEARLAAVFAKYNVVGDNERVVYVAAGYKQCDRLREDNLRAACAELVPIKKF